MISRCPRPPRVVATVFWFLTLLGPACNDLPTAIGPLPVERINIIGGNCFVGASVSLRVTVGGSCEVHAVAVDGNGDTVIENFSWSTENQAIATVSLKPGGFGTIANVTGVSVGGTTVRVEIGGRPEIADDVDLIVFDPRG